MVKKHAIPNELMICEGRFFDVVFDGKKSGKEKTRVARGVYEAVDHVVTG
jgi:hypothetical protein